MELLWILLIVVLALALFGGVGFRNGGFGRRGDVDAVGPDRGGFGFGGGLVSLVVVVALVILLISLLT